MNYLQRKKHEKIARVARFRLLCATLSLVYSIGRYVPMAKINNKNSGKGQSSIKFTINASFLSNL